MGNPHAPADFIQAADEHFIPCGWRLNGLKNRSERQVKNNFIISNLHKAFYCFVLLILLVGYLLRPSLVQLFL